MTKHQTIANAEEQHLAAMSAASSSSATTSTKKTKKVSNRVVKKTFVTSCEEEVTSSTDMTTLTKHESSEKQNSHRGKNSLSAVESSEQHQVEETAHKDLNLEGKKKSKTKKSKKVENEAQNISVKSSFSKFDALQKRNLIHVRSSDAGKAQEKFSNPQEEKEKNCRLCSKPVYKMEEIKAEKSIYHMNCFRCRECNKQLKVDSYQSHEGVPYCNSHFKLLFAPKTVEDAEPELPRRPELIIRENQPEVLPPDVARASDKPDLGLDDLHQLNVRSRFQVFESGIFQKENTKSESRPTNVKRSTSILSKLAKLQAHGFSGSISGGDDVVLPDSDSSSSENEMENDSDQSDDGDADLVRARKRTRELPVGIGKAMDDIKTKFEKGPLITKDERREERKQEIQNIRSRLFMGKQARIKEMYQQAVADSEQAPTSVGRKPEVETDGVARSIKERFENGDVFKVDSANNEKNAGFTNANIRQTVEADVFESGISKQSRSIFMEMDANEASKQNSLLLIGKPKETSKPQRNRVDSHDEPESEIIKCDDKTDDVKVETSEISQKFKFFETYRPKECIKKEFRITPPREGVVKMPSPDKQPEDTTLNLSSNDLEADLLEKTRTTAKMLDKFREMEQNKSRLANNVSPRPLKCFTPPPDGGRRLYDTQESGAEETDEDCAEETSDEGEYDDESNETMRRARQLADDEALKEAQAAARAKQLRAKFEKWEANEIQREMRDGLVDIYSQEVTEGNIESTKAIRARFENMQSTQEKSPLKPRYQVNRFV